MTEPAMNVTKSERLAESQASLLRTLKQKNTGSS